MDMNMRRFVTVLNEVSCSLPRQKRLVVGCALVLAVSAFLPLCPKALAQAQNSGTVSGRVTDGQGSVVSTATITLKSQNQGRVVTLQSNEVGEYVFNSVPVATYTLTITAPSFANYSVKQISVDADVNLTINAVLKPAAQNADVTVIADNTVIDTQSATVAATIDNKLVDNLPLDGNNAIELAGLLPGVTDVNAPTTFTSNTGGPSYNVSGARSNQNLLLLDGVIWNNLYNNTGLNYPTPNALQEVSVLLNSFKAQYGRNAGSVFNSLTKSGSNSVHGALWEFIQNRVFNAADYISQQNPPLVQNQFGATVGGPLRRDKLFYFLSFQDLISDAAVVAQAQTLTLNQRGLTSAGTANPCQTPAYTIYGPCASFQEDSISTWTNPVKGSYATTVISALNAANNVATGSTGQSPCVTLLLSQPSTLPYPEIPNVCWNQVAKALLNKMPFPTTYRQGSTVPYAVSVQKQPRNDKAGSVRVDWNQGKHAFDAHYYQTAVDDRTANGVSAGQGVATYEVNSNTGGVHYGNLGDTWVINSRLLNIARIAYKRYNYQIEPTDRTTMSMLGANYTQPDDIALPYVSLNGRAGLNLGSSTSSARSVDEDVEVDDSLSWSHGAHNFQVGLEFLRLQYLSRSTQPPILDFNTEFTPDSAMDFTLGLLAQTYVGNETNIAAIQHDLYMYAQDDWRFTPRLTLNLGIRYEIPFQWYQPDGQAATFIPGYHSHVFPNAPANFAFVGDPGISRSLVGTTYNSIAPRVGFAYDLLGNGKTSIRGGFGIFYDAINALVVGVSQPFHYFAKQTNNPGGLSNLLLGANPVPADYVKGQANFAGPYAITYPDKNFTTPYTEAMNLGIQHHLGSYSTIEVNYVGRFSRHLALGMDQNPAIYDCSGYYYQLSPSTYCAASGTSNGTILSEFTTQASYLARVKYPNFNYGGKGALDYMTVGSATYNAFQAVYRVKTRKLLTLIASYTYSKSIDVSSNGTGITNSTDQPTLSVHRAVSDFNATQVLNLGWTLQMPHIRGTIRPLRAVVNGWSFNGMYSARTGHPFSVTLFSDATLRNEGQEYAMFLADGYAPMNQHRHRAQKQQEWFNTASFINTSSSSYPIGTYGNAPRNFLKGPAFINTTFSAQRQFALIRNGSKNLTFRADAINVFNTPNLGQPYSALSGAASKNENFGVVLATVGNNGSVGTNGRRLQFSGTIHF